MTDGLFIAFEGGDGAGKSTQVGLLRDAFEASGRTVTVTRQPGGTALGQQIRDLVLHGDHVSPRAEALLYAADKAHHADMVLRPALAADAGHRPSARPTRGRQVTLPITALTSSGPTAPGRPAQNA